MDFSDVAANRTANARRQREYQVGDAGPGSYPIYGKRQRSPGGSERPQKWLDCRVPPPILSLSGSMPGSVQKCSVSGTYLCATSASGGLTSADGVFWPPLYRGGTTIVRTLLAPQFSIASMTGIFTPALASDAGNPAPTGMTLTFQSDIMLPAASSLAGYLIDIGNNVTTSMARFPTAISSYELARLLAGQVRVFSNAGNNPSNILTGEIGGSFVGDTRRLQDFHRGNCFQRASFSKNGVVATTVSNGIAMNFPPMPSAFTNTSQSTMRPLGKLLSSSAVPLSIFFYVTPDNWCSINSTPACQAVPGPSSFPWGCTPSFTLQLGLSANIGGGRYTTNVHAIHLFGRYGAAGPQIAETFLESRAVTLSVNSSSTVDFTAPTNSVRFNTDIRTGIWIATMFYVDIPVANTNLLRCTLATWLSEESELEMSNAFVCRADGLGPGLSVVVGGTLFPQCVDSGLNQAAGNSAGSTPLDPNTGVDRQYEYLSQFFSDEYPDVAAVTLAS